MSKAAEAAKILMQAWEDGAVLDSLPKDVAPANEAEASAISDAIIKAFAHEIGGWGRNRRYQRVGRVSKLLG